LDGAPAFFLDLNSSVGEVFENAQAFVRVGGCGKAWKTRQAAWYALPKRTFMPKQAYSGAITMPASKRWSGLRARCICPRRHLRVLPTRTRPSLFGGD